MENSLGQATAEKNEYNMYWWNESVQDMNDGKEEGIIKDHPHSSHVHVPSS